MSNYLGDKEIHEKYMYNYNGIMKNKLKPQNDMRLKTQLSHAPTSVCIMAKPFDPILLSLVLQNHKNIMEEKC